MAVSPSPHPSAAAAAESAAPFRRALRELVRVQQMRDRERAARAGLTASGAHALEVLAERGALSLTALSAELCVDRSTGCRIVGVLEDRGHVARTADPRDGRAIRVELTGGGRALEARLRGEAVRETGAAVAALPPEERDPFLAALRRLTRASARDAGAVEASFVREEDD